MRKSLYVLLFTLSLLVLACGTVSKNPPVYTEKPDWLILKGDKKVGIILCHGNGQTADGYVVGALRNSIHKDLDYTTLSLTMPSAGVRKHFKKYESDYDDAYKYIQAAYDYLKNDLKIKKIYIVAHSMGSRISSAYLARYPMVKYDGFIGLGMLNNGGYPFDARYNISQVKIPVLDIYAEFGEYKDADYAYERKSLISGSYKQIRIDGATHTFVGHEDKISKVVADWLKSQN